MAELQVFFHSILLWQGLAVLLVLALLVNLLVLHKRRIKHWRKQRVKKAMQHSGIAGYQEKVEALAKDNAELARAPYDTSGIDVVIGLRNQENNLDDIYVDDIQLGRRSGNVVPINSSVSYTINTELEYGLEEYLMGKPTQEELSTAIQCAAQMRESGADGKHVGKCLLNLNYRNKLLEKVLEHAELYMHSGSDPHQHTLLLKAINEVQAAGQSIKHDRDGQDGTFMIS